MPGYDYTKEPEVPFGNNEAADDFFIPSTSAAAPTASADDIAKANEWPTIPPGEHLLKVVGFRDAPKESLYKVMLNGQLASFTSFSVAVKLGLPNNERATVEDYFVLPPVNPNELAAYTRGLAINPQTGQPSPHSKPGMNANKFYHFIDRIGFHYPPGGKLPEQALRLGNWKGRVVMATVEDGGTYKDKNGAEKKGFNRVKFWSYRPANASTTVHGGGQGGGLTAAVLAAHEAGRQQEPAMAGAGAGAGTGASGSATAQRAALGVNDL